MIAPWPVAAPRDLEAEETVAIFQELVTKIRNARTENGVEPGRWIAAIVHAGKRVAVFDQLRNELSFLSRIAPDQLAVVADESRATERDVVAVAGDVVAVLPLSGMVDLTIERSRLEKELEQANQERGRLQGQLGNAAFVERAPAKIVEAQRLRLTVLAETIEVLTRRLAQLGT